MNMTTGINYLDETWSPITGCGGVGCKAKKTCWAKDMVKRFPVIHGIDTMGTDESLYLPVPFSTVQFHPDRLDKPLHWKKPRRIGVAFMGDWMDDQIQINATYFPDRPVLYSTQQIHHLLVAIIRLRVSDLDTLYPG